MQRNDKHSPDNNNFSGLETAANVETVDSAATANQAAVSSIAELETHERSALFKTEYDLLDNLLAANLESMNIWTDSNDWRAYLHFCQNEVMPVLNQSLAARNLPQLNHQLLSAESFSSMSMADSATKSIHLQLLDFNHDIFFFPMITNIVEKENCFEDIVIGKNLKVKDLTTITKAIDVLYDHIERYPRLFDIASLRVVLAKTILQLHFASRQLEKSKDLKTKIHSVLLALYRKLCILETYEVKCHTANGFDDNPQLFKQTVFSIMCTIRISISLEVEDLMKEMYRCYGLYIDAFKAKHPESFDYRQLMYLASCGRMLNISTKKYFHEAFNYAIGLIEKEGCLNKHIMFFLEAMEAFGIDDSGPFNFETNENDIILLEKLHGVSETILKRICQNNSVPIEQRLNVLLLLRQFWHSQIKALSDANKSSLVIKYGVFLINALVAKLNQDEVEDRTTFAFITKLQIRALLELSLQPSAASSFIVLSQSMLQLLLQSLAKPNMNHVYNEATKVLASLIKLILAFDTAKELQGKLLQLTLINLKKDTSILEDNQHQKLYCKFIKCLPPVDSKNVELVMLALEEYQENFDRSDTHYDEQLIAAASALANFHVNGNNERAAVKYYRLIIETCRKSNDLNNAFLPDAIEFENEYLLKNMGNVSDLWRAINYYDRIIENNQILHTPTTKAIYTAQLNLKVALIHKLIGEGKIKAAERIFNQLDCSDNNDLGTDLRTQLLALRIQIDSEKQKRLDAPKSPISQSPHSLFADTTTTKQTSNTKAKIKSPKNKNKKASHKPKAQQIIDANNNNAKPIAKPKYEGGKVGNAVNTRDTTMVLFTVLKPIKEFQALKESNYILYKTLKKAVFEAGTCRDSGDNGLKHLGNGFWEAKVNSKERLLGQVEERDGNKFLVFHTYLKDGLH